MRVVPHSQDTGGFFIVLLRKTGETHGIKNPAAYAKLMAATAAAAAAAGAGAGAAPLSSPDPVVSDAVDEAEAARAKAVLAEMPELDGEGGGAAAAEALAALPPGLDDAEGSKQHKKAVKGKPADKSRPNEDPFEPMNADAVNKIMSVPNRDGQSAVCGWRCGSAPVWIAADSLCSFLSRVPAAQ